MATRKKDVIPATVQDEPVAAPALPNSTPDAIVADTWRDRVDADKSLDATLGEIDTLTRGDETGKAFKLAKSLTSITMTADELVAWHPGSSDAIERAVVAQQEKRAPEASPAHHKLLSHAIFLASCASPDDVATEANKRNGNVRKKLVTGNKVPDDKLPKGHFNGNEAQARAELEALRDKAAKANDKKTLAVYQQAVDAIGQVDRLCQLGNDLASLGMAKSRWRTIIYTGVCASMLDDFADLNPRKKVGTIWKGALMKAMQTHSEYMGQCIKAKKAPDANELSAAIKASVWDKYLAPASGVLAKPEVSEEDNRKKMVAQLWRLVDAICREFTTTLDEGIENWIDKRPDDRSELARPEKAKRNAATAANAEEVAAAKAAADAAAAADDAASAQAKADRKAAREAKATGPAPRQTVVTPAKGKTGLDALKATASGK